jgi:hypothetical protein
MSGLYIHLVVACCSFHFSINIVLYQGSILSHYLFAFMMDEIIKDIQGGITWCMFFIDDMILIDESRTRSDQKLELWK